MSAVDPCRLAGHDWPDEPSMFSGQPLVPSESTCTRCGMRRITRPTGRTYVWTEEVNLDET